MRFALTTDQAALRDAARDLLATHCPPGTVREAWDGKPADGLWRRLADLGLTGAAVPEELGGLGLSDVEMAAVLVEVGYAAVPLPVAETAAVAAPLLAAAGDPGGHLAGVLGGATRVALAGRTRLVPYGGRAELVLDLAGPGLAALADLPAEPVPAIDGSRALVRLAEAPGGAFEVDAGALALARDRAALAVAAQLVGLGRRMLDLTVAYVRERHQFGVPVGGFQAVKHRLADATLEVEFAEPAVLQAAWAAATGAPTRARDVSTAYVLAAEAAAGAARAAIQCHGAMGYTVEYDLHLYAKRAWALAADGDGVDAHLARVADAIGV
ncbi:acyl-CoA dehydrogenase family protein [Phytohabitans kaempferiae]|uniref:acyl-CoA dehydrogenase family protein n=1 Tax=Phytohabitans kaempferiae TaxID=1620943 RepID=UPI00366B6B73